MFWSISFKIIVMVLRLLMGQMASSFPNIYSKQASFVEQLKACIALRQQQMHAITRVIYGSKVTKIKLHTVTLKSVWTRSSADFILE